MKKFSQILGGDLEIKSELGKGTLTTFWIKDYQVEQEMSFSKEIHQEETKGNETTFILESKGNDNNLRSEFKTKVKTIIE